MHKTLSSLKFKFFGCVNNCSAGDNHLAIADMVVTNTIWNSIKWEEKLKFWIQMDSYIL